MYIHLKRSRLLNASINHADMTNVKAFEATFSACEFSDILFNSGDMVKINIINNCSFKNCDFSFSDISNSKISNSEFIQCKFLHSNLTNTYTNSIIFEDCIFEDIDLSLSYIENIDGNIGKVEKASIDKYTLLNMQQSPLKEKLINGGAKILSNTKGYDVVLSFAGEDRTYVNDVAVALKQRGVSVFYDDFEKADLWGKDLVEHLSSIYSQKAEFVIIFVSDYYAKKAWTNIEKRAAFSKFLYGKYDKVLPVVLSKASIEGLLDTKGFLDGNKLSAQQIADSFVLKLISVEVT